MTRPFALLLTGAVILPSVAAYLVLTPEESPIPEESLAPKDNPTNTECPLAATEQGPWQNQLELTVLSENGTEIVDRLEVFVERGGVPSIIQDSAGRLIAAYQWFPCDNNEAFDKVAVSISEDEGKTWSDPQLIKMEGLPETYSRPFDPTLTLSPSGEIRLFFTSAPKESYVFNATFDIFSATSEDGINYTFEDGARFDLDEPVFDSSVIYWDGLWRLLAPLNENDKPEGAYYATSEDGFNFTRGDNIDNYEDTGWTGNLIVTDDGALRFYGIGTRTSGLGWTETTDGTTWSTPQYFGNFFGSDPAVVCLEDRCLMITSGLRPGEAAPAN